MLYFLSEADVLALSSVSFCWLHAIALKDDIAVRIAHDDRDTRPVRHEVINPYALDHVAILPASGESRWLFCCSLVCVLPLLVRLCSILYNEGLKGGDNVLTRIDYDNLQAVDQLPGRGYLEYERPEFLTASHEEYLLDAKLLRGATVSPPGKELEHPNGLVKIQVSPHGYHEMAEFEERLANERRQDRQYRITTALAFLSLPGLLGSLLSFFASQL